MRARALAVVLTALVRCWVVPSASASTISVVDGVLIYEAAPGENNLATLVGELNPFGFPPGRYFSVGDTYGNVGRPNAGAGCLANPNGYGLRSSA